MLTIDKVMPLLVANRVNKKFGGLSAVQDVDLHVEEGEILGLVGPNGAGKTTLLNMISGIYPPDGGSITYHGEDINGSFPEQTLQERDIKNIPAPAVVSRHVGSGVGNGKRPVR